MTESPPPHSPPPPQPGPYGHGADSGYGPGPGYAGLPPYPPVPGSPGAPGGGLFVYPPGATLASPGLRLGARAVDVVVVLLGCTVLVLVAAGLQALTGTDNAAGITIAVVVYASLLLGILCYEPFMHWRYGSTVGKLACRIRVVHVSSGQGLSLGQALGRYWIAFAMGIVPFLGWVNVLWCCWDQPNRQCLHDKAVSSVVILR